MPTNKAISYKDWPHVRVKRKTYKAIKEIATTYDLHMSELLEQAINLWLKEQVTRG